MKDIDIVTGIDTFTVYRVLTWKEKEKIVRAISKLSGYRDDSGDYESEYHCYRSESCAKEGIKIKVEKYKGQPWGLYVKLERQIAAHCTSLTKTAFAGLRKKRTRY